MGKLLSLKDWINSIGVPRVAKLLKVEESTVRHWRIGRCLPRAEQMFAIKKLSKGSVTYDQMIDNHVNSKA